MFRFRVAGCLAALVIAAPAVADDSKTVDCSRGKSVGEVLADKARRHKPLVLRVQGVCTEHVIIYGDDVTLEGDGVGAGIAGSVTIDGGRRAVIAGLAITNPTGDGVLVINGASAIIRDSNISDNGGSGLAVRNASFAQVERNVLSRNGRTITQASGIFLGIASTARGLDNVMEDNRNAGIEAGDNSTYRSDGDVFTAAPSGRAALDIYRASYVEVRRATVTGLVDLNQQSQFQVRNVAGFGASTVTGEIRVSGGFSFLRLRSGVVFTGPLNCVPWSICVVDP